MQLLLIGFIAYFIIIGCIALAVYLYDKGSTKKAYSQVIIGNRSVNYILTALSAHASDMSDWIFMAYPAALYSAGLVNAWIGIGLVCGMWISWSYIAPQLRQATEEYNCMTLSTYFEARFNDRSGAIRLISALISLFFFAVYIAAGLKGFGFLGESVFHIPYAAGTSIAVVCAIAYIFLGGYRALAWIDSFQALFLLGVIVLVPFVGFLHVGGWHAIAAQAAKNSISLSLIPSTWLGLLNALLMAMSWGVGYFGTPHILTKFMGITDAKELVKAKYVGMTWQLCVLTASGLVGLVGIAYFPDMLANKELVFVEMVKTLFNPLSAGIILSAVAGATLSVVTAQMLVLISVLTEDFYRRIFRPHADEKELLVIYRVSIILIAAISFMVSLDKTTSIQQLVQYAWMGFASSFSPLVLLALHSTFINKYGACASILIGGLIAALWHVSVRSFFLVGYGIDIPSVIPGFLLSVMGAYVISSMTSKKINIAFK
jgi:sodium/proline symporter